METNRISKELVLRAISNDINDSIRSLLSHETHLITLVSDLTKAFNACDFSRASRIFSDICLRYSSMFNISRCLEFARSTNAEILDNPSPSVECPSWISEQDISEAAKDL